ncbi:MAG: thioester reductase domain-containing protein [Desulfobacteraceae bacterium]|nr:thioester reductase domain-containing protein [Desulfobacteraceae bacterium]
MALESSYPDFVAVVRAHAQNIPEITAFTFLDLSGEVAERCSFARLDERAMAVAGFLQEHTKPGDRALMIYTPGMPFIHAFIGSLYAGVIAVPVFPPATADMLNRLKHIHQDAGATVVLADATIGPLFHAMAGKSPEWKNTALLETESIEDHWRFQYRPLALEQSSLAFLQYTSGSTGYPKGVMVTHGNLLHNTALIQQFTHLSRSSVAVCWLPHYHDMGLIGCILLPCRAGFPSVLMSPERFVRAPLCWLQAISDHGGTWSTAPNFAYELCIRNSHKLGNQHLDLSSWDTAINGAEPVRRETLEHFYQTFKKYGLRQETLYPAFGMAEATLFIAGGQKGRPANTLDVGRAALGEDRAEALPGGPAPGRIALVGHGNTSHEQQLAIVDYVNLKPCREDQIGEIWLKGPSVAAGYWGKPEVSRDIFQARLANGEGPFLRTGDLGFLHRGELYITGRLKDVIIIHGRNYYPQDIEEAVSHSHPDIRPGRVVAFADQAELGETVCIVAEYRGDGQNSAEVFGRINQIISMEFGIKPAAIALIRPKSLLVTTSGKVRRKDTQQAFFLDRLEHLALYRSAEAKNVMAMPSPVVEQIQGVVLLTELVAKRLQVAPQAIGIDTPLGQFGLSSMDAVALAAELEGLIGRAISPTAIYQHPTIAALAEFLFGSPVKPIPAEPHPAPSSECSIAIIGMACRFPGAKDVEAFWQLIEKGGHAVSRLPDNRPWLKDSADSCDRAANWGGFIEDFSCFDADFFSIGEAEAQWMDPQHRQFIEIAFGAIENAGYAPSNLSGTRTAVFAGIANRDYDQIAAQGAVPAQVYTATGLSTAMLANRLSYLLNLHGPSETIDTACSSSLVAVHRAVRAMRNGECDLAIAGGVNLLLSSQTFQSLSKAGFLSAGGACRTFDAAADGYVRAEGVGAVVLKPLAQAVQDKDHIYAVIRGSALQHGGRTASLSAPSEDRQAQLLQDALRDAGVTPDTVTYIEAHGTGTRLGDPIEVNALTQAFGTAQNRAGHHDKKAYCALGSVKSNIGHAEAAAGIAGLIKCALALYYQKIPVTLHFQNLNPYIDLKHSPFYIAARTIDWSPPTGLDNQPTPRRAGVSSFGFGGAYAHVILEEAILAEPPRSMESEWRLAVLSAKTSATLTRRMEALLQYLQNPLYQTISLADICHTLQLGRDHYPQRAAFIVQSRDELKRVLHQALLEDHLESGGLFAPSVGQSCTAAKSLQTLAQNWLQGAAVAWPALSPKGAGRKVPLPAYPFEKKRYWLPVAAPTARQPFKAAMAAEVRPPNFEELRQWMATEVSQILHLPADQIHVTTGFDELGLDSLGLIHLFDRLKTCFAAQWPISVIQECPSIQSLAERLSGRQSSVRPDLWQEVKTEQHKLQPAYESLKAASPLLHSQGLGRRILLTGATGFLGAFLLRQLLEQTQAIIYCLVRAADPADGLQRLEEIFRRFKINADIPAQRVRVLCGDLTQQYFGLGTEEFTALSASIDTVFHCGAVVDWMKPYHALKRANVEGTTQAIRFSLLHKIKPLHFISSLAVLPLLEGKYEWRESEQPPPEALNNGYAQSKWVAERLCLEARQMGLPVSIYRFDFVAGDVRTGAMKATDFIVRLIKGCIEIGAIPSEEVNFDIHCVDHLSRMIVAMAQLNQPQTYHLINRQPFLISDFARLMRQAGYPVESLGYEHWKRRVQATPCCALFALHPFLDLYSAEQLLHYYRSKIDNTNTLKALLKADQKLIANAPRAHEVMAGVIAFFQKQKHLPLPKQAMVLRRQTDYWQRQLQGAPSRLALAHQIRGLAPATEAGAIEFTLPEELMAGIGRLAAAEKAAAAEILLAAFQLLLMRYGGGNDIPVATALSIATDSPHHGLPKIPIIRTLFSPPLSFRELLLAVKQSVSEAHAHLDLPSEEIAAALYPPGHPGQPTRYDALFAYRGAGPKTGADARLNWFPMHLSDLRPHLGPLSLLVEEVASDGFKGRIQFASPPLTDDTARRLVRHLIQLLRSIGENPDQDIFRLSLMEPAECRQILFEWNATRKTHPAHLGVPELFRRQAQARPEAIALELDGRHMSYGELDLRSDQWASYLQKHGLGAGDVIGLGLEKSFELIIAMLAVLKAGSAYVALDLSYPQERLKYMLTDAQAKILFTRWELLNRLPDTGATIICVDKPMPAANIIANAPAAVGAPSPDRGSNDHDLAYMIYTSGTTGRPKGVKVRHAGLVNLLLGIDEHLQLQPGARAITIASLNYDASVLEIFYPLVKGATLVLAPREISNDGVRLKKFLETKHLALLIAATPTWRMLEHAGWPGDPGITLLNGGEALPYNLAQTLVQWSQAAFNGYGPAEATVCATIKRLEFDQQVTIGRPMANTQIYILDEHLNPMPIGAAGELYIGGHGLAQGYHGRPELTSERFIPNPFDPEVSAKIYNTGDLARFLPNGEIAFVGRIDNQVKIRGHRIELEEIERVVTQNDEIKACTALLREDKAGEKKIVAYIIPAREPRPFHLAELKKSLKHLLPEHMIPSDFVVMDQFPVTLGGKIDRRAFPAPATAVCNEPYVAPTTALEARIAQVWRSILNLDQISIHTSFLDLGGDSISATRLLIDLNAGFNLDLTIQSIYENLTVARLAELIERHRNQSDSRRAKAPIDFASEIAFRLDLEMDRAPMDRALFHQPERIFLTGATGFLGAYILARLLEKSSAAIYCLVRAQSAFMGAQRIQANLKQLALWREDFVHRITPVLGDLSQPRLGMDAGTFESLSQQMNAIYHCGSVVNFAYPYPFLKKPNVEGTKEILNLAAHRKIKPLFYISTMGVFEQNGFVGGKTIQEEDELGDPDKLFFGYSQSKWVAEKIVASARKAGLPISIFRPSSVLGDRTNGCANLEDLVNVMIRTFTKVRAFPDLDFQINGVPVDAAADAIVSIALTPLAQGRNYHIVHPRVVPVRRLIEYCISGGYDFPVLPCAQWLELLAAQANGHGDLTPYVPVIRQEITSMNGNLLPEFSFANTLQAIPDYRQTMPVIDKDLFQRYLAHLEKIKFIQRPA